MGNVISPGPNTSCEMALTDHRVTGNRLVPTARYRPRSARDEIWIVHTIGEGTVLLTHAATLRAAPKVVQHPLGSGYPARYNS
jgi:hypothetical protein